MKDIIVIIGPTGVGKTKLSIELAKKLNAEIINGDSVSIYKKLNIGSAKPTPKEQAEIKHHLIDICPVTKDYTVYDYQQDVRSLITKLTKGNKRIIIVGGTGLYIKAALYNYKFTKETVFNNYDDLSNEELLNKIKKYSTESLPHLNNRQRLIRLLNKLENNEEITNLKDEALYPLKVIGLTAPREILYERINKRVDTMIEKGLLEEIASLQKYYSQSRVLNSAIGYKEFAQNASLEDIIKQIKQNSRHYAKRQYTFFKHQFPTKWFNVNFTNFDETINEVYNYIKKEEA